MARRPRRRHSTIRLLRAVWRYHGRIESHGNQYQAEVATAVRTALDERFAGRTALAGYRLGMRLLVVGVVFLLLLAALAGAGLWQVAHPLAPLALVPLVGAGMLTWWRLSWGASLDWLEEHADPDRVVPVRELPARLRALAAESRRMADVPARLSDELDALAGDVEPAAP